MWSSIMQTENLHRLLTLLLTLLGVVSSAVAYGESRHFHELNELSLKALYDRGQTYWHQRGMADSALVCFTLVTNRYDERLTKEEKIFCARGHIGVWEVLFFHYRYDIVRVYDQLLRAQQICETDSISLPLLDACLGSAYQTVYAQNDDVEAGRLGVSYSRKAFHAALDQGDVGVAETAFTNLVTLESAFGTMADMAAEGERYMQLDTITYRAPDLQFNRLSYQVALAVDQGLWDEALALADRQVASLPADKRFDRQRYIALANRADIYAKMGRPARAITEMTQASRLAVVMDDIDVRMETARVLRIWYEQLGDTMGMARTTQQFYELKDSLLNRQQIGQLREIRFLEQISRLDLDIERMRHRADVQQLALAALTLIVVLAVMTLTVIVRKNKKLRRQARKLYDSYQQKYQSSTLADATKEQLVDRIKAVMEGSNEIFSPDFSAHRLAELAETPYIHVSQVINEQLGCNFNILLGRYRIREACRRIADTEHYGHLNIEGISSSVGFRSRTTFSTAFRRETGLTPSEYMRIEKTKKA